MQGISQFTPQRVVQVDRTPRANPYALAGAQLAGQLVMNMIQNKLQGNLQKQQLAQEMQAKGYTWDEANQTWTPPPSQIEEVAPGISIYSKGDRTLQIQDPRFMTDEAIRQNEASQRIGAKYDIDRINLQADINKQQMYDQAKLSLENAMTQRGAKKNDSGEWEYQKPTFGKDEKSGVWYMQFGDGNVTQIDPIGEAVVTPITGLKGKAMVQIGSKSQLIDTNENWLDENNKPRSFTTPEGMTGVFTSPNSAQMFDTSKTGQFKAEDVAKFLDQTLFDMSIPQEQKDRVKINFMLEMAKPGTNPTAAANKALDTLKPSSDLTTEEGVTTAYKLYEATGGKEGISYNEAFKRLKELRAKKK